MKIKPIKQFWLGHSCNGRLVKPGDEPFDVPDERGRELIKQGYAVEHRGLTKDVKDQTKNKEPIVPEVENGE